MRTVCTEYMKWIKPLTDMCRGLGECKDRKDNGGGVGVRGGEGIGIKFSGGLFESLVQPELVMVDMIKTVL